MKPTKLMLKMVEKMTPAERAAALKATNEAIVKGGGSITLQGTRWQMLAALKAAQ